MRLRILIPVLLGAILLIFIIFWTVNIVTMGKLTINTSSKFNSIDISLANAQSQPSGFPRHGNGSLSLTLRSGSYIVSVQGSSVATSQVVDVKARVHQTLTINPPAATGVEPVSFDNPEDFASSGQQLSYLSSNDSTINELSAGNAHAAFGGNYSFQSVAWADPTYGVAQDGNGRLYVVSGTTVSQLASPVTGSSVIFAVAPDRTIFIALGSDVYSGTPATGFKKIYSQRADGTLLVAGPGGKVAIINGGESDEGTGNDSDGDGLVVVDHTGNAIKEAISPIAASWSASGQYLAISTESGGEILDSSLNKVALIPQNGFSTPVWLDNNIMYYKIQDQLWSYNRESQKSQLVANMPLGEAVQQISVSTDKAYIYVTTADDNNNLALRRVGLRGQTVPQLIYNLQDILPQTSDDPGYILGLYNFSGTATVTLTPLPGADPGSELQLVKQTLQSDGFDLSQLQFVVNPTSSG